MSDDGLKETMVRAAAARYGAEHYRGILAARYALKVAPVLLAVGVIVAAGWVFTVSSPTGRWEGAAIVGGMLTVVLVLWLIIRRSPYRRRRYWR